MFNSYNSNSEHDPEAYNRWLKYKEQNLEDLLQKKVPTWSDETFQSEKQEFIFPFYDGSKFLGLAITLFDEKFEQVHAAKVEILIETCRGLYLTPLALPSKVSNKEVS